MVAVGFLDRDAGLLVFAAATPVSVGEPEFEAAVDRASGG
jgi:hypothetical protein